MLPGVLEFTAEDDLRTGQLLFHGEACGYVMANVHAGQTCHLLTDGVVHADKSETDAFTIGEDVFWNEEHAIAVRNPAFPRMGICVGMGNAGNRKFLLKLNAPRND